MALENKEVLENLTKQREKRSSNLSNFVPLF